MRSQDCPLCLSESTHHFHFQEKFQRDFYKCNACKLIFVDRLQLVSPGVEKERYSLHDNSQRSKGYEAFLSRLIEPINSHLPKTAAGLDFGEGPYPMLRELFQEAGFTNISGFDPYFNPDSGVLNQKYDFITCCEVIEHMSKPSIQIKDLIAMVNKRGILIFSTGVFNSEIDFSSWHYINDETHINIFSQKTFEYIGQVLDLEIIEQDLDLIVFSKI